MTENEAIKELEERIEFIDKSYKEEARQYREVLKTAVSCMQEIRQYRSIGTVSECQEAVEKHKAKKPIVYVVTNRADCPTCGATVRGIGKSFGNWCSKCGQRLDWSNYNN